MSCYHFPFNVNYAFPHVLLDLTIREYFPDCKQKIKKVLKKFCEPCGSRDEGDKRI